MEVAVKTMQNDACEGERIKFLQEAATMGQFNNPYVVKLYGVITSSCPVSEIIKAKISPLIRIIHPS